MGKPVKFTLPDDIYNVFAARAEAHEQTVNEFIRSRLIDSLTAKQAAKQAARPSAQPLARTTVEPRWKVKDQPKARKDS